MKISKIIDELTELKELIGDKELEACTVNDATAGVNVMYLNDEGGWVSTCLEGEKMERLMKATMSDQDALGQDLNHNGEGDNMMNYLAENTFLTKENYEDRLNEIKSWFDKEDKTGDYDALSVIEELKLLCEAKDAYIRHLEAPVRSTDTPYVVEYIGVKDDRKFYKYGYYNTEPEALAVFNILSRENPYITYMKVSDLNNKILKEMACGKA